MDSSNFWVWLARSLLSGPGCLDALLLMLGGALLIRRLVRFIGDRKGGAEPEWTIPNLPIQASTLPPAAEKIADARCRIAQARREEATKLAQRLVDAYLEMLPTQSHTEITVPIAEGCPGEIVNEAAGLLIERGWYVFLASESVYRSVKMMPAQPRQHIYATGQPPLIPKPRRLG